MSQILTIVDKDTGELLTAGTQTLDELAASINQCLSVNDKNNWTIGRDLSIARGKLPDNEAFGEWCCNNLLQVTRQSLHRYRRRFEVFGDRKDDVALIPVSAQYTLAAPDMDDYRDEVIERVKREVTNRGLDKASIKMVDEVIEKVSGNVLATLHTGDEESYTPEIYIESARYVMGSIDTDPASNPMAQETVKAGIYYTVDNDGLSKDWDGNVWMNPPYTARVINTFITKLVNHYKAGDINQAIVLTNNNTDTSWFHEAAATASAICFTAGRINFLKRDGSTSSPTNGQLFFYFGCNHTEFVAEFSAHGYVMVAA